MDGIAEFQKEKTMHFRIFNLSALVLLFAFLMPVEAQKAVNHLGQKIENHVVLVDGFVLEEQEPCPGFSFDKRDFFRIFPDGSTSSTPFRVPNGFNLMITDVEWTADNNDSFDNTGLSSRLRITIGSDTLASVVFQCLATVTGTLNGYTGNNNYSTTGFVVGEEAILCPNALSGRS